MLTAAAPAAAQSLPQAGCDPLDPAVCLQPWPNDFFTRPDASTPTGKRLNLQLTAMPRNVAGVPIRPDEYNRNDGFSPGSPIHTFVPGLDFARSGLVPDHRHGARVRRRPAGRRDRRRHRRAAADLGGDGRQREVRRRPQPLHPPGPQLGGGPPLHRRPALPARRAGPRARGPAGLPRLPRQGPRHAPPGRPAPRAHGRAVQDAQQGGHQAQGPLPGVGLHRRLRAAHLRADARHPRRRLRPARRHGPRRLAGRRAARPTFRVTQVQDTPSESADHPHGRGAPSPSRATSTSRAARPAREFLYTDLDSNTPTRIPGNTRGADVHLHHPAQGAGRPAAGLPLRPRPVRQPERGDGGQREDDGRRPRLRLLRHRLVGDGRSRTCRPRSGSWETCRTSRSCPTACSRGCSTSCSSAGSRSTRRASTSDPAFQVGRASRARHARALLRRQLAGRDHRRLADRGRARLPPRGARRAGHELLDAAAALGRLRPVRRDPLPGATRARSSGR